MADFEVNGQLLKSSAVSPISTKIDAVPLLDLQRQYAQIREEVLAAIERVCASQHFILGAEVEALEREVVAFTGSTAAVGCSSGTDAFWLALLPREFNPATQWLPRLSVSSLRPVPLCAQGRGRFLQTSIRGR